MMFLQTFIEEILEGKQMLTEHALNLVSKKRRNLILLCLNQIEKCILLMLKTYQCGGWNSCAPSFKVSISEFMYGTNILNQLRKS